MPVVKFYMDISHGRLINHGRLAQRSVAIIHPFPEHVMHASIRYHLTRMRKVEQRIIDMWSAQSLITAMRERRKNPDLKLDSDLSICSHEKMMHTTRHWRGYQNEARDRAAAKYYSTVVIGERDGKFSLHYGGDLMNGTGPFDSFDEAVDWFVGGGR